MTVNFQPAGSHTVIPYLVVQDAAALIDFTTSALGAVETERMLRQDGTIMHAEVRIGDSIVMIGQAPAGAAAMPGMLYVYVPDVDAAYQAMLSEGATSLQEPKDEFYGHRTAGAVDSNGNQWWLATVVEKLSPEEQQRRAAEQPMQAA
jgi:PhnB protein